MEWDRVTAATQTCTGGLWSLTCAGEVTPQTELCDGLDNNCSGAADETFDLTSNPLHCGACNYRCSDHVPNAVSACQASTCVVVACLPGFYDLDPMAPGCEYPCTLQNGGMKTCGSLADQRLQRDRGRLGVRSPDRPGELRRL